jgi:hypothetical protein
MCGVHRDSIHFLRENTLALFFVALKYRKMEARCG